MNSEYIPQRQDIVWIDFDPSAGKEIQKRRPALVVSNKNYSKHTGFVAVCPITHGQAKLRKKDYWYLSSQKRWTELLILSNYTLSTLRLGVSKRSLNLMTKNL